MVASWSGDSSILQHSPLRWTWDQRSLRRKQNFLNLIQASDFVKMSLIMSLVGQYCKATWPVVMVWHIKWKWTLMYFVCPWNVASFERWIAPWLLQKRVVGKVKLKIEENLVSNLWIHKMCFEVWVNTMYSVSVLDKVMMGCFLLLLITAQSKWIWKLSDGVYGKPSLHLSSLWDLNDHLQEQVWGF